MQRVLRPRRAAHLQGEAAHRQLDVQRQQAHARRQLARQPLQVRHALAGRPAARARAAFTDMIAMAQAMA